MKNVNANNKLICLFIISRNKVIIIIEYDCVFGGDNHYIFKSAVYENILVNYSHLLPVEILFFETFKLLLITTRRDW